MMKKILSINIFLSLLTPLYAYQPIKSLLPPVEDTKIQPQQHPQENNVLNKALAGEVKAGGYGGNKRIGRLVYLDTPTSLPAFDVTRAVDTKICFLKNQHAILLDQHYKTITFNCPARDADHNNLFWDDSLGAVNGGYSPENDVLYASNVVTNMFFDWYNIAPFLDKNGLPTPIVFVMHQPIDDAGLDHEYEYILVGDGKNKYYPFSSLSTISGMIGLLFTDQHSDLNWPEPESGGINVAFGCMTAMAAEYYATGTNTWQVGAEIAKNGEAFHYLDKPSKDCHGHKPGDDCSIDTYAQFNPGVSYYYSSGLYNRAFYLLATSRGWNTRKAYDVFVQANRYHWKRNTNFHAGACDVVASTKEIGYDAMSVMIAFSAVGIDTRDC